MDKPWWAPSSPDEIRATPWLSPEAIAFLESILFSDATVIEHGSGGSTLWMASRVKSIVSFEQDDDWRARITKAHRPNVKIYGGEIVHVDPADILFIDGEPVEERARWLKHAQARTKAGGWIVLDNANRPEYKAERDALNDFADLVYHTEPPVGTKYLMTEFWKVRE